MHSIFIEFTEVAKNQYLLMKTTKFQHPHLFKFLTKNYQVGCVTFGEQIYAYIFKTILKFRLITPFFLVMDHGYSGSKHSIRHHQHYTRRQLLCMSHITYYHIFKLIDQYIIDNYHIWSQRMKELNCKVVKKLKIQKISWKRNPIHSICALSFSRIKYSKLSVGNFHFVFPQIHQDGYKGIAFWMKLSYRLQFSLQGKKRKKKIISLNFKVFNKYYCSH